MVEKFTFFSSGRLRSNSQLFPVLGKVTFSSLDNLKSELSDNNQRTRPKRPTKFHFFSQIEQ